MAKTINLLIIVGAFVFGLGMIHTPAQESEVIYGLVSVDSALVHVGPDFAYPSVDALPRNTSVVVLGRAGDFFRRWDGRQWLEIEYGGGSAWVYARLIRTSQLFNDIFPTGRVLPRNRDGRVPEGFDLSTEVCSQWQDPMTLTGNFMAGDEELIVTVPELPGTTVYSVIAISPTGFRTPFDSETHVIVIELNRLPNTEGTYTWRVAPYWTDSSYRYYWQQICLLRTGGTFDKPLTDFDRAGSLHGVQDEDDD